MLKNFIFALVAVLFTSFPFALKAQDVAEIASMESETAASGEAEEAGAEKEVTADDMPMECDEFASAEECAAMGKKKPVSDEHTSTSVYVCSGRGKIPIYVTKDEDYMEFANFEAIYDVATGSYQRNMTVEETYSETPVSPTNIAVNAKQNELKFVILPVTTVFRLVTIDIKKLTYKEEVFTEHESNVTIPTYTLKGKCRRINVEDPDQDNL